MTCQTCRYWEHWSNIGHANKPGGKCRRYAPAVSTATIEETRWPWTLHDDWCGEWSTSRPFTHDIHGDVIFSHAAGADHE